MVELMEQMGGSIATGLTRENIMYQGIFYKNDLEKAISLFSESICSPRITEYEIEETRATIEWEGIQKKEKPIEGILPDIVHKAAYGNSTLGLPLHNFNELGSITMDKVFKFRDMFYQPQNIVIATLGCNHDLSVELVDKHFGNMRSSQKNDSLFSESAEYVGDNSLIEFYDPPPNEPFTHTLLSFESSSFMKDDIYPTSVLQMLLGGGDSFSAGGPGKGMYSRLYTNILNKFYWVDKAVAENSSYSDSGLFTVHLATPTMAIPAIVDAIGYELRSLISDIGSKASHNNSRLTQLELDRAKNQLRAALFMNLESPVVHLEDIGRQVQMKGSRSSTAEMSDKIEQVKIEDVERVVRGLLDESKLSAVVYGNVKGKEIDQVQKGLENFKSKYLEYK